MAHGKVTPNKSEFLRIMSENATLGKRAKKYYESVPVEIRRLELFLFQKDLDDLQVSIFGLGKHKL